MPRHGEDMEKLRAAKGGNSCRVSAIPCLGAINKHPTEGIKLTQYAVSRAEDKQKKEIAKTAGGKQQRE
jgi:hypothetical protein